MTKPTDVNMSEWIGNGIKSLIFCVFTMFTFFVNNLNKSIDALTGQLKTMEQHQVETDKRVAAIEVSREINMAGYQKVVQDVQDIKNSVIQLTMRTQTISDFIANSFVQKKK